MLVQFRRLGMEGQQVLARVVLVVGHLAVHRPEIAMDVEEVHIDGNLDAIPLEILLLEHFLHDHDLAVGHGGNHPVVLVIRHRAVGHAEEIGDEKHEDHQHGRDRDGDPGIVDETGCQPDQDATDAPGGQNGFVGVFVDADTTDQSLHCFSSVKADR